MKKLTSILLVGAMIFTLVGCGNKNTSESESNTDSEKVFSETTKEIKLNEPFKVSTDDGDYNFTVKSVTKTDWWKREHKNNDKTVILLNLECENISYKNEKVNGVLLYKAFNVKDNNNYLLTRSSTGYSNENDGTTEVPVNSKSKVSMPYIIDNNITSVSIEFLRGGVLKDIPITD